MVNDGDANDEKGVFDVDKDKRNCFLVLVYSLGIYMYNDNAGPFCCFFLLCLDTTTTQISFCFCFDICVTSMSIFIYRVLSPYPTCVPSFRSVVPFAHGPVSKHSFLCVEGGTDRQNSPNKKKKTYLGLEIPLNLLTPEPTPSPPTQRHHLHPLPHNNLPIRPLHSTDLVGVIRQQFNLLLAQVEQHGRREAVAPRIGRVSQQQIRFDGVAPQVLQVVRFEFLAEPDPAAFLAEVDYDAAGFVGGEGHEAGGFVELFAAVAAGGPGCFARVAFAVDAYEGDIVSILRFAVLLLLLLLLLWYCC